MSDYSEMMARCSHCGLCQATCPVYLEDLLQTHLARARMELIRASLVEGSLPVSRRLREVVDRCLLCTNCSQTCAAGIPVDEIIAAARHQLHQGRQYGPVRRRLTGIWMRKRGASAIIGGAAAMGRRMGLVPGEVPPSAPKPFTRLCKGTFPATGARRARVAYYVGCATNSISPDTGLAAVQVLNHNGIEVVVPQGLVCCGIPALAEGSLTISQEMVRTNIRILAGLEVDAVVTDCTSCGLMLRSKALKILSLEDPLRKEAEALGLRVWEVMDYLNQLGLRAEPGPLPGRFTYHVPCHRGWTPTLNDAPRKTLSRVPGFVLVESEHPEHCCGAGGAFFLDHLDLARKIRSRKIDEILRTEAATVVTPCPACRAFLAPRLPGLTVEHPVSLLARSYRL